MNTLSSLNRPSALAFLQRIRRPIRPGVMAQEVYIPPQQLAQIIEPQQTESGRIGKGDVGVRVRAKDALGGGVQQEPRTLFAFLQSVQRLLALCDVDSGGYDVRN